MKNDIFELARQIQAYSKTGLYYVKDKYEIDRYTQILDSSVEIISLLSDEKPEKVKLYLNNDNLYVTPKVDLRSVVFNKSGQILLVKEKLDDHWALPGGFCDIGYSPSEVAVKETKEEAGIEVEPVKLLGVYDKKNHNYPRNIYYMYTIFIQCEKISRDEKPGMETSDVGYFSIDDLPQLSTPRVTEDQLREVYKFYTGERSDAFFD